MTSELKTIALAPALIPVLAALLCFHVGVSHAGCVTNITESTPDSQLTDNVDFTVTDKATKLMWKQCSEGLNNDATCTGSRIIYDWQSSLEIPVTLNAGGGFAGYTDWRLPNIKELASIIDEACSSPAINTTRFPNNTNDRFWSSSPTSNDVNRSWFVNFSNGQLGQTSRGQDYRVRLVRSAP